MANIHQMRPSSSLAYGKPLVKSFILVWSHWPYYKTTFWGAINNKKQFQEQEHTTWIRRTRKKSIRDGCKDFLILNIFPVCMIVALRLSSMFPIHKQPKYFEKFCAFAICHNWTFILFQQLTQEKHMFLCSIAQSG